jgi:hypothetical protein
MPQVESLAGKPASARMPISAGGQSGLQRLDLWDRSFYLWMSLLIAGVVVYGFSHTVGGRLIRPPSRPPLILYFHAVLFTGWLLFFIVQSALVRTRNVKVHRKLGWFGLAMGVAMPFVGITTAIVMTRLRIRQGSTDAAAFMIVPFFDMVEFTVPFALAFYWRTRPESHRRLMLIASCALTAAAFGRLPSPLMDHWFYGGVDALILLAVVRDVIVTKRVHPAYLYGLPLMMLGQIAVTYAFVKSLPQWLKIAHALLS